MHITWFCPALLALASKALAASYSISDNVVGDQFYSSFVFEAITDPTNGRVEYVDRSTAKAANLTYASEDTFIMRADHTTYLDPSGSGRQSVRIRSTNTYTTHVVVFDIRHMPQGCATWPAAWESSVSDWPNLGELDVIEGVNDKQPNLMSVHTTSGCTMPSSTDQTGHFQRTNCTSSAGNDAGCSVTAPNDNAYGPAFNSNGGGWYALERTNSAIKIWFWPRSSSPPYDVSGGPDSIDTSDWGTPVANFPNTYCDLASKFGPNNIIINLTLCGDWAGSTYSSDGCPGDCVDRVNSNPGAFTNAYWDFAAVRVYE